MMTKFDKIFNLIQKSFPENEYRPYEKQKKLLDNPNYKVLIKENSENNISAIMAVWSIGTFNFIEHLAVEESCRGKGIGSEMIKNFIANSPKPIVLEIEIPTDETSKKRLAFYEKLGFKANGYEYHQLPLRTGAEAIQMVLMSYPQKLDINEFKNIKKQIYETVYKN